MQKYLKLAPAFLIGAAIALLLFLFAFGLFPTKGQICEYTQAGQEHCTTNNIALVFLWKVGKALDAASAAITAFASGVLAIVTWRLVTLSKDQSETTRAQLRAYLSAETGITLRQSNRYHARFEFRINIVNNGQTPASKVQILSKIEFIPIPVPEDFDFTLKRPPNFPPGSISAIAPGKDKFHSAIFYRFLTWRELRDHAKGIKQFHLWGEVTYEDIFKRVRHTHFSFLILVPTKKTSQVFWLATDRHNDYD